MLDVQTVKVSKNIKNETKIHLKFNEKSIQKKYSKKESQNMKTHSKSDPKMNQNPSQIIPKIDPISRMRQRGRWRGSVCAPVDPGGPRLTEEMVALSI